MELFSGNIPSAWLTSTPAAVSRATQPGRVHSGNSSVRLENGAHLRENVAILGERFYELSFFANAEGDRVAVAATVTFLNAQGQILQPASVQANCNQALRIVVNGNDIPNAPRVFSYYRGITSLAPAGATTARIDFNVSAAHCQALFLDDVSLAAR